MEDKLEQIGAQVTDLSKQVAGQLADVSKQLSGFEHHLTTAVRDLKHQAQVNMEALRTEVKVAAEGYGAILGGIERELTDLNTKVDTKFGDHDLVLANHNTRITKLEQR